MRRKGLGFMTRMVNDILPMRREDSQKCSGSESELQFTDPLEILSIVEGNKAMINPLVLAFADYQDSLIGSSLLDLMTFEGVLKIYRLILGDMSYLDPTLLNMVKEEKLESFVLLSAVSYNILTPHLQGCVLMFWVSWKLYMGALPREAEAIIMDRLSVWESLSYREKMPISLLYLWQVVNKQEEILWEDENIFIRMFAKECVEDFSEDPEWNQLAKLFLSASTLERLSADDCIINTID